MENVVRLFLKFPPTKLFDAHFNNLVYDFSRSSETLKINLRRCRDKANLDFKLFPMSVERRSSEIHSVAARRSAELHEAIKSSRRCKNNDN